jgi:pimeloyl-ACP methyl ester carboxylesterase
MPTQRLNGIDLYWEQAGVGPRLLMFNGSGSTIERMRPLFDVLATQFDVVVHDQRGLGRTEIPEGPYSMADYATDAIALVDFLGWDAFHVIGISFGGMVAQEFAVTVPERVERLALLCTSPGGEGGSSYPLHKIRSMDAAERAAISMTIMDTRFTPEWLDEHPSDRLFVDGISGQYGAKAGTEAERGEIEQLNARSVHDVWDRLDRITAPTFIGAGRYDGIAPLSNSEAMAERIPNAQLHVYEGGHGFFAQDATAFPDIFSFLAN